MNSVQKPSISDVLNIKSVAIVGISASMGYYWPHSMLQWEHDLSVHLVSLSGGEVLGKPVYKRVLDIPDEIDYAIVAVPHPAVEEVLKDVVKKGAKGATIFTSGYSELGTKEGWEREESLKRLTDTLPIRVFGPNCMGLMYPKIGFAFMPTIKQLSGNVGFLSQSGGVVITSYTAAVEAGIGFSKIFSFGNAIDIYPSELLDYFEDDEETDVIGLYIEGTEHGKHLLHSLERVARKKPIVAIKGGRSQEGTRAVSSHTGALAGRNDIWNAAFNQANVVTVDTLEDFQATLGLFSKCPLPKSRDVGILAISGGTSVIYTDLCVERGLSVPESSPETQEKLRSLIREVGNAVGNPIDLAADYYHDQIMREVILVAGAEPRFSSLIFQADVHNIYQVAALMNATDVIKHLWRAMAEAGRETTDKEGKPVLIAIPEVAYPEARQVAWNEFLKQGLPVFRNINEAVGALARVCKYQETRAERIALKG